MANVYEEIARVSAQITKTTDPDQRAKLNADLLALNDKLPRPRRRAEFDCGDDGAPAGSGTKAFSFRSLLDRPARNDAEREAATFVDSAIILGALLHKDPRETRYWRRMLDETPGLKAMDTSAGSDWIPTEVSATLMAQVRLETRVASLLQNIDMPTATYKLPLQ